MDCLLQLLSPNAVSPLLTAENSRPLLRWPAYISTAHHAHCPCLLIQRFLSPSAFHLPIVLPARRRFNDFEMRSLYNFSFAVHIEYLLLR